MLNKKPKTIKRLKKIFGIISLSVIVTTWSLSSVFVLADSSKIVYAEVNPENPDNTENTDDVFEEYVPKENGEDSENSENPENPAGGENSENGEDSVNPENIDEGSSINYESLIVNYKADYNQMVFNSDNGIKSIEVNAITQTPDGFIWIGSYAGLYRYDGTNFQEIILDSRITSVTSFYVDDNDRLWIGTNDKGIFVYDIYTSETIRYSTDDGLPSNSIRCICEDGAGGIYFGTSSYLCSLNADGVITSYDNLADITFVNNLICLSDGMIIGSTNEGGYFAIKDGKLDSCGYVISDDFLVTCVSVLDENKIFIGTVSGDIYTADKNNIKNTSLYVESSKIGNLANVARILYDSNGGCFVCADNGLGYYDINGNFQDLKTDNFHGAASDILLDYQNDIWISSSKYGVCKLSYNPFSDIFKSVGLAPTPVNAVSKFQDLLYIATDNGLFIVDENAKKIVTDEKLSFLEDVRIRDIYKDSKGNIWLSSYTTGGIVKLEKNGSIKRFGEDEGAIGTKYRSTIELPDGTIAEASNLGITFIKDDKVVGTVGEKDGMIVPQILCMQIADDGSLIAGSDGDGIYIIKDGKLVGRKGNDEGLEALVILRMVKAKEGIIYVCSDALYYDNGEIVTKLDKFPYSNNYDVYISNDNEAWVSSSAGLFVLNADELVGNGDYDYILLNKHNGFDTTLVANSWNYVDEKENLYFCCSNGVKKLSIPDYGKINNDYNIFIYEVNFDEETKMLSSNVESISIPAGVNRVAFSTAVLNYSLSNPLIHIYLEGFDDTGLVMNQSDMTEINFTNIPYGSYNLHIQVLDEVDRTITREMIIPVNKESEFYETTGFRVYLFIVICFVLFFTAWLLAKYASINELKFQYNETRKAKDEAEKANRAKSQFLAKMSHEIRTPINAILGMDELIMREEISDTVYSQASDIKSAATSLLSMINDLLDFSKIESNKMHLVEQEYKVAHLLDDVSIVLISDAKRKGLEPIIKVDSKTPASLIGDEVRIRQILLNLVSNAIKYSEKGSVTLSIDLVNIDKENKKASIRFSVKDTGIGIKPDEMDKLFESFERVDEKRNAAVQGTGLGLPITRELAILMGSNIEVDSEYGKGSEFYFVLSQSYVASDTDEVVEIGEYKHGLSRDTKEKAKRIPKFTAPEIKILVVDDNSINRKVVKGLLKETLCQIDLAVSGKECLEKTKEVKYDIILLDHMMPEMDGIETFEKLKESSYFDIKTPVLALTANAIEGAKEEYMKVGFTDYISKPISGDKLEEILMKYIPKDKLNEPK